MKNKQRLIFIAIVFFFGLETYCIISKERNLSAYSNPFLLLFAECTMGLLLLGVKPTAVFTTDTWYHRLAITAAVITGGILTFSWVAPLYQVIPIDPSISDIIPLIEKMSSRFLAGEYPYAMVQDFGYDLPPTYLPAQWMPYLIAAKGKFDPRWVSWGVFVLALTIHGWVLFRQKVALPLSLLLIALPVYTFYRFQQNYPYDIASTVELLTASYYWLLGLALLSGSFTWRAVMLILCLMSRFSLLFWLPLYLFLVWLTEGGSRAVRLGLIVVVSCALWYGVFWIQDPTIFTKAQKAYTAAAQTEWARTDFNHLSQGLGLAIFFKQSFTNIADGVAAIQKTLYLSLTALSLILGVVFYRFRAYFDARLFSLGALKLSLALFYALVQVPYSYLFLVPLFLSFSIFNLKNNGSDIHHRRHF